MDQRKKIGILIVLTVLAVIAVSLLRPIAQEPSFHSFADKRVFFLVPNFLNIATNIPFICIGIYGLSTLYRSERIVPPRLIYILIFMGIVLTGFGSAYYHFRPDNGSLLYDRLPMTIVFMSFLSAIVAHCISRRVGVYFVIPLVLIGIASVFWWHFTELRNEGDLRFYALVQFYPIAFIPLILVLFPSKNNKRHIKLFIWIICWYLIAKLFEHYDHLIFEHVRIMSGHSLKHLAAAVSTWLIVADYKLQINNHPQFSLAANMTEVMWRHDHHPD